MEVSIMEAFTMTVSLTAQPPPSLLVVRTYEVVTRGLARGFAIAGSLRPVTGLHEYTNPGFAFAPICTGLWLQLILSLPAFDRTVNVSISTAYMVSLQPYPSYGVNSTASVVPTAGGGEKFRLCWLPSI